MPDGCFEQQDLSATAASDKSHHNNSHGNQQQQNILQQENSAQVLKVITVMSTRTTAKSNSSHSCQLRQLPRSFSSQSLGSSGGPRLPTKAQPRKTSYGHYPRRWSRYLLCKRPPRQQTLPTYLCWGHGPAYPGRQFQISLLTLAVRGREDGQTDG